MKSSLLENIEKEIEEVVKQYRENPSEELYQKWIDKVAEYSKQHQALKQV